MAGATYCDQRDKEYLPWETRRVFCPYLLGGPNALGRTSSSKFKSTLPDRKYINRNIVFRKCFDTGKT